MALTIICVRGISSTGKSTTIRDFTTQCLKYKKKKGDVRGVFQMPRRRYAVGVSSMGDAPRRVKEGFDFMSPYVGIRVMIVACHPVGGTIAEVQRFAAQNNAQVLYVDTGKIIGSARQKTAIAANIRGIKRLLP
jgi:hypothetical protein